MKVRNAVLVAFTALALLAGSGACTTARVDPTVAATIARRIAARQIVLTPELLDRFAEVAFGSEYGGEARLVTWAQPLRVQILGAPTPADLTTVDAVLRDLEELLLDTDLRRVDRSGNVVLTFTDQAGFEKHAPRRAWTNAGYFRLHWHPKTCHVRSARVLVRSAGLTQRQRDHVIREELTQVLGLMRDIDEAGSVFSQQDGGALAYSALDRETVRLWEALRPLSGQDRETVIAVLRHVASDRP